MACHPFESFTSFEFGWDYYNKYTKCVKKPDVHLII